MSEAKKTLAEREEKAHKEVINDCMPLGWKSDDPDALSVEVDGQILYPQFQFAYGDTLHENIRLALHELPQADMTRWEVVLWWFAHNGWLDGKRPVDMSLDEKVIEAARHMNDESYL